MPRYDVFLEGRTESSTCYFGVAVMADDQKEAEFLGHEAGRVKHQECDEIEVVGVMPVTSTRNAGKVPKRYVSRSGELSESVAACENGCGAYWEDEDFSIGQDGMFYDNKYTEDGQA